MATATTCRNLLLAAVVLAGQLCVCTAYVGVDGFSVEFIHRDSVKSPYHDPALTEHDRVLAAVRRSTVRAAALARSYVGGEGAVSEAVSSSFEYLMAVNVGTPPTRMLAIADTGSDLVWFKCAPRTAAARAMPPRAVFNPSSSSTFRRVGCHSGACQALQYSISCDARSNCQYFRSYVDGTKTSGLLSTETFTFESIPGGCPGCRSHPYVLVPNVTFGCSTSTNSTFVVDAMVGLGAGRTSLIGQLGAKTSLGRRFSYCLLPYNVKNASSAFNFGDRATVTEPGAATTALVRSDFEAYYTILLESVRIGNASFQHLSRVIVDSGTPMTFLDKALVDQMVNELSKRIGTGFRKLPSLPSPLQLCYDVGGPSRRYWFNKSVPDVTLYLAFVGVAVTLKAENTFMEWEEGIMCLAVAPVSKDRPLAILGSVAQQNMHVGYNLDKRTLTFAPADCASSYRSSLPVHG
ncbi:aspartic proteinase CDR1-like [Lolium perenne]|uniref:aspartic proteinase CDR1-like n=1 Tax=Lolium perenne TaxID=4522 RepID=UPI0021F6180C|nr:aspartic proteinase CDR1-like [Lolium perenne]